jgi:hypothetical protein
MMGAGCRCKTVKCARNNVHLKCVTKEVGSSGHLLQTVGILLYNPAVLVSYDAIHVYKYYRGKKFTLFPE